MSLGLTGALTASSTFALVVHDPGQLSENIRQVLAVLDQIDRATTQIRNQWKMLQKLPVSVGRSLEIAGDRLVRSMRPTLPSPLTNLGRLSQQMEEQLPIMFVGDERGWLDEQRPGWTHEARENVIAQRELQNVIYENFETTSLRVEQLVRASNGEGYSPDQKPGQTAVLQARNELLGTLAHETNNLIGLKAARLQAEQQRHAQEKTAAAFNRHRRDRLMSDWPSSR